MGRVSDDRAPAASAAPAGPGAGHLTALVRSGPYLNGYHDVARQWPDAIRRRVDAATERAAVRRRAVRTPHDALAYQAAVRERFWQSMGGRPEPAQREAAFETAGDLEHLGVRVTRLVYESHPGVPVSALLYRPRGGGGRRPAVLFLSGHHETAKHHPEYQRVCLDLALHGLVVLAIDPWGQGERFQYAAPGAEQPLVATGTYEHSYSGLQCFLAGGAVARYFAWDAVRALDVLGGVPEVDPARIGVTGNSGGGTQTVLLLMADERPAAAMPCTFIHGLSAYVRAGLPHDAEQNFVGSLAGAIDHADLLACFAPRPLLVGAVGSDFFPLEATEESVAGARGVYAALGAGERIALTVDDDRHWYTDVLRERAVRFFTATLDGAERYERRDIPTLPEARLWCSPSGQLYRDRRGLRTVFDLNREFLAARRRPAPATADEARARLVRALDWPLPPETLPLRPRYFPPPRARAGSPPSASSSSPSRTWPSPGRCCAPRPRAAAPAPGSSSCRTARRATRTRFWRPTGWSPGATGSASSTCAGGAPCGPTPPRGGRSIPGSASKPTTPTWPCSWTARPSPSGPSTSPGPWRSSPATRPRRAGSPSAPTARPPCGATSPPPSIRASSPSTSPPGCPPGARWSIPASSIPGR